MIRSAIGYSEDTVMKTISTCTKFNGHPNFIATSSIESAALNVENTA